jgi:Phosphate acetyl/butaryl transferase
MATSTTSIRACSSICASSSRQYGWSACCPNSQPTQIRSDLIKGIQSPVAGKANILLVPDLESGNMLAKQLASLARADSAGIVVGARVPMMLTSRADSAEARLTSFAVAVARGLRENQKFKGTDQSTSSS